MIGGLHYQQYRYAFYSSVPTLGPMFLLNFVTETMLGRFLIAPFRSWLGRRGRLLDQSAAPAGTGVAAGGLAALLVSEQTPLFGFTEHGYRMAIVLAVASDAAAIVMLTLFRFCARSDARKRGSTAPHGRSGERVPQRPGAAAAEN